MGNARILVRMSLFHKNLDKTGSISSGALQDAKHLLSKVHQTKACNGEPSIIMFSDGSEDTYEACAYLRWKLPDGSFDSNLIASTCRVAPLKRISVPCLELCGAVLSKWLRKFIAAESHLQFTKEHFIVDSEIIRAMLQKELYGFNTFAAIRIREIQEGNNLKDWYWFEGKVNIADWTTRGKSPDEIGVAKGAFISPAF